MYQAGICTHVKTPRLFVGAFSFYRQRDLKYNRYRLRTSDGRLRPYDRSRHPHQDGKTWEYYILEILDLVSFVFFVLSRAY